MIRSIFCSLCLFLPLPTIHAQEAQALDPLTQWGQWRGPMATGEAPKANPPIEWDEKKNIRWKASLPGKGHSSPVVWGNHIFLTTAVPYGEKMKPKYSGAPGAHDNVPVTQSHRYVVLAIDRRNGKILWEKTVAKAIPHEGGHYTGSLASASPVTDGETVIASFGSQGLYALNFKGDVVWKKDLGRLNTKHGHGEGSSPCLYADTVIITQDHEGQSYVAAYDKKTGKQKWKADRDEVTSWATPIVVVHQGRPQVIVPGTKRIRAYDLANGKVLWECGGLSANIVASPVSANGVVYSGSSYVRRAFLAIRLKGAKGDITKKENVLWHRQGSSPYVPSPLLYKDTLYFMRHYQGILFRVDAKTGKNSGGPFRLGISNLYASPVAANGRIYFTDRNGITLVINHTDKDPTVLAVNRLGDTFSASAAIVGKELFLRGEKTLYCIAEKK